MKTLKENGFIGYGVFIAVLCSCCVRRRHGATQIQNRMRPLQCPRRQTFLTTAIHS